MQYKSPPITEAELYIFFSTEKNIMPEEILENFKSYSANYSLIKPMYRNEKRHTLSFDEDSGALDAYMFKDKENGRSFYISSDSLGVHKLAPYIDWNDLNGELLRIWGLLTNKFDVSSVNQITCKYQNRIDIPKTEFDPLEYVTCGIHLGDGLGEEINNFLIRFHTPIEEKFRAIITQKNVEPPAEGVCSIALDLELQKRITSFENFNLEKEMVRIRIEKNRIFESLITEKTRELFE